MPWSGGVFTPLWSWVVDAITNPNILASRFDTYEDDQATGINTCLTKDGQNIPTANLPMGGFTHTGVGNATVRTQYAAVGQVQDGSFTTSTDTGAADAYVITLAPAITAYTTGQLFWVKLAHTNTTTSTLNVNSLGAKTIKNGGTTDVTSGQLVSGKLYGFQYDGTNFQVVGSISPASVTEFADDVFRIDGSADATKKLAFEVDGLTTATTRTVTLQDVSGTMYVSGGTDIPVADGGTGASTVAGAQVVFGILQHAQSFSATGTFTPAAGVTRVFVEVWGGGGGGGGAGATNGYAGGGGGGGGYSSGFVDVTPATGHTVTIGGGGGGGSAVGGNGSGGTNSSFAGASVTVTANGGSGGTGGSSGALTNAGGAGGSSSNGTINLTGGRGQVGQYLSGVYTSAGAGGNSPKGGQGYPGGTGALPTTGSSGTSPGGGGSGAIGSGGGGATGGSGADGMVVVYYP